LDRFDRFFVLREDLRRRPPFREFIPLFVDRVDDMRVGLLLAGLVFAGLVFAGLLFAGGIGGTVVVPEAVFDGGFPRPNAPFISFKKPIVFYIFLRNKRV
jgi:hypothetical protein